MTCSCARIYVGTEATDSFNLSLDCPVHGLKSEWYNSAEQVTKRRERNNVLRQLQLKAKAARNK